MRTQTLLLLLAAPMQSWGVSSIATGQRDTGRFPSRSGVVGLLAACQGMDRLVSPEWSEPLRMHVRLDQPGRVLRDFHTIGGGYPVDASLMRSAGRRKGGAVVTRRDYLCDAAFVVALTGPSDLVQRLAEAVQRPIYTPFLGRKSCPPASPLLIGVTDHDDPTEALSVVPAYRRNDRRSSMRRMEIAAPLDPLAADVGFDDIEETAPEEVETVTLTVVTENPEYTEMTAQDAPVSFNHWHRTYGTRTLGRTEVTVPVAGRGFSRRDGVIESVGLVAMRDAINSMEEAG